MEKKQEFITNVIYYALIFALIYLAVNYALGIVLPFVLGFIFAYIAVKANKKFFNNDKKIYRILTLFALYFFIVIIAWLLINLGINKLGDFIKTLPGFYKNTLEPYISSLEANLIKLGDSLPDYIADSLSDITNNLFDAIKSVLSSLASGLVSFTTNALSNAPNLLITVIVTIVTSFYFVIDYEEIAEWFTTSLSKNALKTFYEIKDFFENILVKIISAYTTIMLITFVELFIGLSLFRVSNSGMWAFIISLLDIFPVLGVGTVLIPWGISSLITGNFVLGIEILVLYLIITFIRNIIEPKMVGTNLGLHPLATLFSMIVGLRLFGAVGMFGFPLTLSFFRSRRQNKLKKQKERK